MKRKFKDLKDITPHEFYFKYWRINGEKPKLRQHEKEYLDRYVTTNQKTIANENVHNAETYYKKD